jgi:hypothetical protein
MTLEDEWVPVSNFPGYSVNPLGQVRKDSTGRVLHTRLNQYGVPYVGLMREWQQCIRSLPRLVATAFLPPSNAIFDTPINLDGDRTNCAVDNLMWRPRWYAIRYLNQFDEERYPHPIQAPVRAMETGEVFDNSLAAACRYGLLEREVVMSVLNKVPTWPTYQMFELAHVL